MGNLQNTGTSQKVLEWITLSLATLFFILGAGILSGLILGDHNVFRGAMKIPVGLILMGYGIIRSGMIFRRMILRKKGDGGE